MGNQPTKTTGGKGNPKEIKKDEVWKSIWLTPSPSGQAEEESQPKDDSLQKLIKTCDEKDYLEDYKECKSNIAKLIKIQELARYVNNRKGAEYGNFIYNWIRAIKDVTESIPSPRFSDANYRKADMFSKRWNKIIIQHATDFQSFAGSLTPTVVTQEIINDAFKIASDKVAALETGHAKGPDDLLVSVLAVTEALPRLISDAENYVDDFCTLDTDRNNLEHKVKKICNSRVEEIKSAKMTSQLESYREEFIRFCDENPNLGVRAGRILELARTGKVADQINKIPNWLLDLEAASTFSQEDTIPEELSENISSSAARLIEIISKEANSIVLKLTKPTEIWRDEFNNISNKQINELRSNSSVKGELDKNNMSILYVSWSDVGRAKMSCVGPNITDMQFFAIPPLALRLAAPRYLDLDEGLFCSFPAVRSPNFTDEVDIRTAAKYTFKVRTIEGKIEEVSMKSFLEHIGKYITDLEPEANWGDAIDLKEENIQVSSQFSVLPLLKSSDYKVELGISAFGYQKKNLHIIVGPNGDLGWAPEGPGYKRIFFRDTAGTMDAIVIACESYFEGSKYISNLICRFALGYAQELRAIALVPEDRADVSKAFFKEPLTNESIAEEAKRYAKVENKLIHIQIEMERGEGVGDFCSKEMFSCDSLTQIARDLESKRDPRSFVKSSRLRIMKSIDEQIASNKLDYKYISRKVTNSPERCLLKCSMMGGPMMEASYLGGPMGSLRRRSRGRVKSRSRGRVKKKPAPSLGLLLARVQMGDSVGRADQSDVIPIGSTRSKGVSVRVTEMFYSVARNAEFTKPRIHRFMQQMSFANRAGQLAHGSLVTGKGNWGKKLFQWT